jgi:ABC-type transport system involved in cytochrome bd biosynthesis fused ATPase/permease subunit
MVLKSTLDYLAQPLDSTDLSLLRHMAVCGAITLVIIIIGFSKFIIITFYLLIFGIILIITWLYSLECRKRAMVIERIKEVLNSLMQTCIDEAMQKSDQWAGKGERNNNRDGVDEKKNDVMMTKVHREQADGSTSSSGVNSNEIQRDDMADVFSKLLQ